MQLDNKKKYFLNVPMGCYALITKETPEEIKGLFTDSLGPCACLIITDEKHEHIFLAHIPGEAMNIADLIYGIIPWITRMEAASKELNIEIHCGKGFQEGMTNLVNYEKIIKDILKANDFGKLIEKVKMYDVTNITASMVCRKGTLIKIRDKEQPTNNSLLCSYNILYNLDGDPSTGFDVALKENNFEAISFPNLSYWRKFGINCESKQDIEDLFDEEHYILAYIKLKYELSKEINLTISKSNEDTTLPFPPICCYDGVRLYNEETESLEEKDVENTVTILNSKYEKVIEEYKNKIKKIVGQIEKNIGVTRSQSGEIYFKEIRRTFNEEYNNISKDVMKGGCSSYTSYQGNNKVEIIQNYFIESIRGEETVGQQRTTPPATELKYKPFKEDRNVQKIQ